MTLYRGAPLSLEAESFRIDPVAVCYRGFSTSTVTAIGTTWQGYSTFAPDTTDEEQAGIFREGSIFSFSQSGLYCAQIALSVGLPAAQGYYGMRLWNGLTQLQHTAFYATQNVLRLDGLFRVYTPSDMALEVCRTGTAAAFGTSTLDGDPTRTAAISFLRVGA